MKTRMKRDGLGSVGDPSRQRTRRTIVLAERGSPEDGKIFAPHLTSIRDVDIPTSTLLSRVLPEFGGAGGRPPVRPTHSRAKFSANGAPTSDRTQLHNEGRAETSRDVRTPSCRGESMIGHRGPRDESFLPENFSLSYYMGCGTSRNVSDPAASSSVTLQPQPVERRLKKASVANEESPPPVTLEEEEEGGQNPTTASGNAIQQPVALAEERESLPDGAAASARCFAHHYVKAISAPGRARVVRRQRNREGAAAPGSAATFPGEDGVAADDGPKHGFPAGGLSALGNVRDQQGKGESAGGGGVSEPRERGAGWWHDLESGGSDGEKVGNERNEGRSLARSYMAHFKDFPPRCRPALREMARKAAEIKAAEAAASNTALELPSPATAEAGPVAVADAGAMDRWHVPTLQGAVNFVEKKIKSAIDGCSEGGLQEQARGVMHLEVSLTATFLRCKRASIQTLMVDVFTAHCAARHRESVAFSQCLCTNPIRCK